jgi:hypothetical protein
MLDKAIDETDSMRRLVWVVANQIAGISCFERGNKKLFNALLGETYEFVTPKFKYISEQISHHPIVTSFECQGNSGYRKYATSEAKIKFHGTYVMLVPLHKEYVELLPHNEKYQL